MKKCFLNILPAAQSQNLNECSTASRTIHDFTCSCKDFSVKQDQSPKHSIFCVCNDCVQKRAIEDEIDNGSATSRTFERSMPVHDYDSYENVKQDYRLQGTKRFTYTDVDKPSFSRVRDGPMEENKLLLEKFENLQSQFDILHRSHECLVRGHCAFIGNTGKIFKKNNC